jgi:subtilisin
MRPRFLLGVSIVALVSILVAATGAAAAAKPTAMGSYIVVLKDSAGAPATVASHQARNFGAKVGFVYGSALKGYSATMPVADVQALRRDPRVAYVTADRTVRTEAQTLRPGSTASTASGRALCRAMAAAASTWTWP